MAKLVLVVPQIVLSVIEMQQVKQQNANYVMENIHI